MTLLFSPQGDHMYIQLELCQESLGSMLTTTKDPWREPELVGLMKQVNTAEASCRLVGLMWALVACT